MDFDNNRSKWCFLAKLAQAEIRDVTDSASASDGIRHFFRNPKSDGYLKSD